MTAAAARPGLKAMLVRLRGRPDSEHEMSVNRVVFGTGIFCYAQAIGAPPANIAVLIAYTLIAIAVLIHIAADDRIWPERRILVMAIDIVALAHTMHANGAACAAFYPLFLWIILGNGFRFGERYLWAGVGGSVLGFGGVICTTGFWWNAPALSTGLLLGLVALPAYSATLIRKLSKATLAAEQASRAKSYFLASVSHELRTPLTAIIGLGDHLANADPDPERRATTRTIVAAGRSLLGMINQLLDYSRVEAKGAEIEVRPFELAGLLAGIRDLMQFQAQQKGLRLNLHIAANAPTTLRGDDSRLRDILVNLVGNALKFTEAGSITIAAGVERLAGGAHQLRLAVTDTGIGIAADAQERIFASFAQADDTIIDRFGGTGLGLAICKQLVELMGGEIGVVSAPGTGARFWLTTPIAIDEDAPSPDATGARLLLFSADPALVATIGRDVECRGDRESLRALYDPAHTSVVLTDPHLLARQAIAPTEFADSLGSNVVGVLLTDKSDPPRDPRAIERTFATCVARDAGPAEIDRAIASALALAGREATVPAIADPPARASLDILVADDNRMNQKVFGMVLGRAGHRVTAAADGEAALDLMRDRRFDVVLMDVNMPVLNGIEATKLYRFAALGTRRVPIVAVTADASSETAERCREAGMDACIAKPVEAEPLLDLIDALVGAAEGAAPAVRAHDPTGVVTPLRPADALPEPAAIDWRSLEELEELGGRDFVIELIDVYVRDSESLLASVTASIVAGDVAAFRSNTHALRSSAANVGAAQVAQLCLHFQRIGETEFATRGTRHRDRLAAELARAAAALGQRSEWRVAAGAA